MLPEFLDVQIAVLPGLAEVYYINGIAWYCIVLYCVVGFGARAVSRKTPIYFININKYKEEI